MKDTAAAAPSNRSTLARAVAALAAATCLLAPAGAGAVSAPSASGGPTSPAAGGVTAALEQCVTSVLQGERGATFTGEMTAIAGTAKMSMRIDIEERGPAAAEFRTVGADVLDVWRSSQPKVKVYKYLRQVTNLSSPASYRARVRFRWINSRGRVIRRAERLTASCLQPATPPEAPPKAKAPEANGPSLPGGAVTAAPAA